MSNLQAEVTAHVKRLAKDQSSWRIDSYDSSQDDPGDPRGGGMVYHLRYKTLIEVVVHKDFMKDTYTTSTDYSLTVGGSRIGTLGELGLSAVVQGILDEIHSRKVLDSLEAAVGLLEATHSSSISRSYWDR